MCVCVRRVECPGDEGAFSIAQVLAKATGMEDFRMSSTRVMEQGGMVLAKAIAQGGCVCCGVSRGLDAKDNTDMCKVSISMRNRLAAYQHPSNGPGMWRSSTRPQNINRRLLAISGLEV